MTNQSVEKASIVECFHRMIDFRDHETAEHCLRVADLAVQFAKTLQLTEKDIEIIQQGALLHDIGFIGIPDSILWKPIPYGEEEVMILRHHPEYGYHLLQPLDALSDVVEIIYCHHEQWNGAGYPRGLKRDEISRNVRIVSIVNEWDRLRSDKPYELGMSGQEAKRLIQEQSGKMFEPELVTQFFNMVG